MRRRWIKKNCVFSLNLNKLTWSHHRKATCWQFKFAKKKIQKQKQKWFQNLTSAVSASIVDCDKMSTLPMSQNVGKMILSTFHNRLHASTRSVGGGHDLLRPPQQQQLHLHHQQQQQHQLNCHLEKSYLNRRRIHRKVRYASLEVFTKFSSKNVKICLSIENKTLLTKMSLIRQR